MPLSPIIFFDSTCLFCQGSVQWIIKRDKNQLFRFASLNSHLAKKLLKGQFLPEYILIKKVMEILSESDAVIFILQQLGVGWKLLGIIGKFLPTSMRNKCYRYFANHRYKWFRKNDHCMLFPEYQRHLFLD